MISGFRGGVDSPHRACLMGLLLLLASACAPPPTGDPIRPTPEDLPTFETISALPQDFIGETGQAIWSELRFERFFPPNPKPQGAVWQVEKLDQRGPLQQWRNTFSTDSNADVVTETTLGVADLLPLALHSESSSPSGYFLWHQEIVQEITAAEGSLFPLSEGQVFELTTKFRHRLVDTQDRDWNRKRTYRFKILSRYESYDQSKPPVPGPIFVIERIEDLDGEKLRSLMHYSSALGYTVLIRHEYPDDTAEEKRLVEWR